ncbi:hypothetical protein Lal_00038292 [Lupinus albus]|uniref:Uncharacterized protein n=1 Tax=Lupinus albus TaxID=3870 RepID=A0A6A5NCT4_LUPAL|nr:hypothetical protein Lalb_Chr19g0125111 [Lupinus albus]KAF1883937.1 hypothetical protein Lal_00038292 [Lupinus albus]
MDSSRNSIVKLALLFIFLIIATNMLKESNATTTTDQRARKLCQNDSECLTTPNSGCKCDKGDKLIGWCVCPTLPLTHN